MKNTRKIAALIAALLLASLLCACGKSDSSAPMGYMRVSSEDVSYNLFVPDEWTADMSTGTASAYVNDGSGDNSNISLMSYTLPGREVQTIEDYWALYEPDLKAMFPDLEYVGEPEETTLGDTPAVQYIYTGTHAGVQYKYMQIIAFRNGEVYIFTYTATADNYDTHIKDVVDGILKNFSFK